MCVRLEGPKSEANGSGGGRGKTGGNLSGFAGDWDQFAANEQFGVRATYNENLYTTPKPRLSADKEAEADRLARGA